MAFRTRPNHPEQALAWLLDAEIIIQLHAWEDRAALIEIADALVCAPALAVSVVFDHAEALEAVHTLLDRTDGRMLVGMSKIESVWDVIDAARAGAAFALGPEFQPGVWKQARALDLLYIPGVFSHAEVQAARDAGLRTQFLFPADILGPEHAARLHSDFPDIHFLPGVNLTVASASAYRRAGAAAAVVELPMLGRADWRQADIITFVRELLGAWRAAAPEE